jgi:hypothetical protein
MAQPLLFKCGPYRVRTSDPPDMSGCSEPAELRAFDESLDQLSALPAFYLPFPCVCESLGVELLGEHHLPVVFHSGEASV